MTTSKTKTNGKRNKSAGHGFELDVVKDLRIIYPKAVTSRSCNRMRDAEKIDIVHQDELKYGRLPYNIQCKSVTGSIPYLRLMQQIPKEPGVINAVFHKYTVKKGSRFMTAGRFAITDLEDFYTLAKYRKAFELLNEHFDQLPQNIQEELQPHLTALEV